MVRVRDVSGADEEEEKGTETSKCDQSDFQGSFMLDYTADHTPKKECAD